MGGLVIRGVEFAIEKTHNIAMGLFLRGVDGGDVGGKIAKYVNLINVIGGGNGFGFLVREEFGELLCSDVTLPGVVTVGVLHKESTNLVEHCIWIKQLDGRSGTEGKAVLSGVGSSILLETVGIGHLGNMCEFV